MKRVIKYISLLIVLLILNKFLWLLDPFLAKVYDAITNQKTVKVFTKSNFTYVNFNELPETERLKYTKKTCNSFNYEKANFIKLSWFDRYKNVVGSKKAYQFLTPDRLTKNRVKIPNLNKTQYLLLDPNVLELYSKLVTEMKKEKLNTDNFIITSAFRNPKYNILISGAKCSQHQFGKALDISIGDVNNDGKINITDRNLVYKILNDKVVAHKGGLGSYKNSPKLIHLDSRNYRARW